MFQRIIQKVTGASQENLNASTASSTDVPSSSASAPPIQQQRRSAPTKKFMKKKGPVKSMPKQRIGSSSESLNGNCIEQVQCNNLGGISDSGSDSGGGGRGSIGMRSKMKGAYKAASHVVRERMKVENEEDFEVLDSITNEDVVVVKGTYDHIHRVLKALNMPFTHVSAETLLKLELRPDQTVYVNCSCQFPKTAALKLEKFVRSGGQLITTDWALLNVLEAAFPGYVKYNGKATGDEVVQIQVLDRSDEVMSGFIAEGNDASPVWWLEGSSYPIKVLDSEKVTKLVVSREMANKYGEDSIIVRFQHGEGTVYHMVSHFYLQRTETRDKKHEGKAEDYAECQKLSSNVWKKVQDESNAVDGISFAHVQSAATSSEFVSRAVVKHKRRWAGVMKKAAGSPPSSPPLAAAPAPEENADISPVANVENAAYPAFPKAVLIEGLGSTIQENRSVEEWERVDIPNVDD